jgi:hypothetical protein
VQWIITINKSKKSCSICGWLDSSYPIPSPPHPFYFPVFVPCEHTINSRSSHPETLFACVCYDGFAELLACL